MQAVLEDALEVPVGLISLPSAEVIGEVFAGAAADRDDAVLIFLSHGIGAGILSRGRLLVGAGGAVGELGHCPVGSGIRCTCGRDGCLETVAAGWAIRAEAVSLLGRPELAHADLAELEAPATTRASTRCWTARPKRSAPPRRGSRTSWIPRS